MRKGSKMSSSRENSPDWLRCFQAPTQSALIISSPSDSPPDGGSPVSEDDEDSLSIKKLNKKETIHVPEENNKQNAGESPGNKTLKAKLQSKKTKAEHTPSKKRKRDTEGNRGDEKVEKKETPKKPREPNHSVWTLSSDSESCPDTSPIKEEAIHHEERPTHETSQHSEEEEAKDSVRADIGGHSPLQETSKVKSPKKLLKTEDRIATNKKKLSIPMPKEGNDGDMEAVEENLAEKHIEPRVSSSRLPLVLSEKVSRSKALVECEGDSVDLSGDVGAVGRIVISDDQSGNHEMFLDLKGTIYKTTIVPSRTFCVVSFGQSEAKIEAIMNDFIQLKPQSNVYEAETMVEGTLDGFSFDSEDEADKMPKAVAHPTDENERAKEQSNGKSRGRADKTSGAARRKGKAAGGKAQKKVKRKPQVARKTNKKK